MMRRLNVHKIREILKLKYDSNLSVRNIAASCNCSKSTVQDILKRAEKAGIKYPVVLPNKKLIEKLYPPTERNNPVLEPDVNYIHLEMKKKNVTLMLLWEEYKSQNPNGLMYTQYCERYRQFKRLNQLSMRKEHKAGEEMEVDWAGSTMKVINRITGEIEKAYIFVAVLPASRYPFVYAYPNMSQRSWIDAHVRAFKFIGGTPKILIPDNTKTAIIKTDTYDPMINKSYNEMANHYQTAIVPARVCRPKDKALGENHVKIVSQRIIATLRNQQFFSFKELNDSIEIELMKLINRPFQKMDYTRQSLFDITDKLFLRPLPQNHYEYAEWKTVKVQYNYHVEFEKYFYSIHYSHVGKMALLRATDSMIEVFIEHERIAVHTRNHHPYKRYVTLREHMPKEHQSVSDWSEERFLNWAKNTGPNTYKYIKAILESKDFPQQSYKTCMSIMSFTKKYSNEIMEQSCKEAFDKKLFSYKYFSNIIKTIHGKSSEDSSSKSSDIVMHDNIRGLKGIIGGETIAH